MRAKNLIGMAVLLCALLICYVQPASATAGISTRWYKQILEDTPTQTVVNLTGYFATADSCSLVVRVDSLANTPTRLTIDLIVFNVQGVTAHLFWQDKTSGNYLGELITTLGAASGGAFGMLDYRNWIGGRGSTSAIAPGSITVKITNVSLTDCFSILMVLRKHY